jgi:hypothetical protein
LEVDEDEAFKFCFKGLDPKELDNVQTIEWRRSVHSKIWAKNAFDSWKVYKLFDTSKLIINLHEFDPKLLVNYLFQFLLQVAKKNEELYLFSKQDSHVFNVCVHFVVLIFLYRRLNIFL